MKDAIDRKWPARPIRAGGRRLNRTAEEEDDGKDQQRDDEEIAG